MHISSYLCGRATFALKLVNVDRILEPVTTTVFAVTSHAGDRRPPLFLVALYTLCRLHTCRVHVYLSKQRKNHVLMCRSSRRTWYVNRDQLNPTTSAGSHCSETVLQRIRVRMQQSSLSSVATSLFDAIVCVLADTKSARLGRALVQLRHMF